MATAEYSFPQLDEPETRPLSMPAQVLVVALGILIAIVVGVLLVLAASS